MFWHNEDGNILVGLQAQLLDTLSKLFDCFPEEYPFRGSGDWNKCSLPLFNSSKHYCQLCDLNLFRRCYLRAYVAQATLET